MNRKELTDKLIIFLCTLSLALGFISSAYALADLDGDLLPDDWETLYFGNLSAAPHSDPDGDRFTNIDEHFAGTDPTIYTQASSLSERQLLRLFQGKTFLFFWEQSELPYYFTHDNAFYDGTNGSQNFNSNAALGFSFTAYVVADENDWVPHTDAYNRIKTALARLVELQGSAYDVVGGPLNQQGNRHGYIYHFIDNDGFRSFNNVEISTIDHALLTAGALVAASYYPGTEVEILAHQLFDNTEWSWLYDGNVFYQGWLEGCSAGDHCIEGGHTLDAWNRYSELMILLFQGMSAAPPNGVSSHAWEYLAFGQPVMFPFEWAHVFSGNDPQNFSFVPDMPDASEAPGFRNGPGELHYLHAGSIHNHQYSHMYADFRVRRDGYRGTDFFSNSVSATMASRAFCIQLNTHAFGGDPENPDPHLEQPYETYAPDVWGLGAGIASDGTYKVIQPVVMSWEDFSAENIARNNDSGTVSLFAPLGSAAFTPRETIDFSRNILERYQNNEEWFGGLINRYGVANSFNRGRGYYRPDPPGHLSTSTIGIDLGAIVGAIENHLTGLVWKMAMRQSRITNGMANGAGFDVGAVEPFIMNFDADNLPPHDPEWSGAGGQDPNVFGGNLNPFGTGSIQYVSIGDPRPDIPYGPEEFAVEISTTDIDDSGAFITLNNHSVSRWDRLSFWIKGASADEDFLVGLNDSPVDYKGGWVLEETEHKVRIADYMAGGTITDVWTEVRIPLSDFGDPGVRLTRLHNISFANLKAGGGHVWVDDIAFLGDEFPPSAPVNVQVTVQNDTDVLVTWDPNGEKDVVGYNVYRRIPGDIDFDKLNSTLLVGTQFVDAGQGTELFEYAITAVDNAVPQNESVFSNVFFWTVHHMMPDVTAETYSSAASAKMILAYLGADPALTQTEIYDYGLTQNLPGSQTPGSELDPRGLDSALDHFDPPGYHFMPISKASTGTFEYMRDLAHWMDYPVPNVSPAKVPPAVPIFGTYDHWVVVNGFSASADPLPNESNPWFTPDFFVYGFWLTDPDTSGIGVNRFISAEEAVMTYFLPLSTGDLYDGRLVLVAEPPEIDSRAKATPFVLPTGIAHDEAAGFFSERDAAKVRLTGSPSETDHPGIDALDWNRIIPYVVRLDASFSRAYAGTSAARYISVNDADPNGKYRIVTFEKRDASEENSGTSVAVIVNGETVQFREAAWVREPVLYEMLSEAEAKYIAYRYYKKTFRPAQPYPATVSIRTYDNLSEPDIDSVSAELVWWPGNPVSSSPFTPFWRVSIGRLIFYVDQTGRITPPFRPRLYETVDAS